MNKTALTTRKMTYLALLTALVVVLQFAGSFIHIGRFSVTLVLLPIVVGAALCGAWSGAWLGAVFGIAVFITGDAADFLTVDPLGTVITVMLKGILAGLAAGLIYRLLEKFNVMLAVFVAACVAPIVNTGIFILGGFIFFLDTLEMWGSSLGFSSAGEYLILGMAGGNFIFELAFNLVLAPIAVKLINLAPVMQDRKK
jgi:uncharacterized membrane protein